MAMRLNQDLPPGTGETRRITFGDPTALNTNVIGKDSRTGFDWFRLSSINSLLRAIVDLALATTNVSYEFDILRDGYPIKTIYGDQIKRDQQFVSEIFPLNLQAGVYQIAMRQTAGTLAGRTLLVTWQVPLVAPGQP